MNAIKTKNMIVSTSCTIHPKSPHLTLNRTVLKDSDAMGVTFVAKVTFEKIFALSCAAAQWFGIMRKSLADISRKVAPTEIFLELCPAGLGVLISSVILSC